MFFLYLTPASASSYWVSKELDAAFIRDAEHKGGTFAFFVDNDATRQTLSLDLRATHCPILNDKEYDRPLWQLIARAWEATGERAKRLVAAERELQNLKLEKRIAELETEVAKLENGGRIDITHIKSVLEQRFFSHKDIRLNLLNIFTLLSDTLAAGTTDTHFDYRLAEIFAIENKSLLPSSFTAATGVRTNAIVGPLVVYGLVEVRPPTDNWGELLYLTPVGRSFTVEVERDVLLKGGRA